MGAGQGRARGQLAGQWEQLFSYVTHCINLVYIALHFHEDIPKGYLFMGCTRTALEIYQRDRGVKICFWLTRPVGLEGGKKHSPL